MTKKEQLALNYERIAEKAVKKGDYKKAVINLCFCLALLHEMVREHGKKTFKFAKRFNLN